MSHSQCPSLRCAATHNTTSMAVLPPGLTNRASRPFWMEKVVAAWDQHALVNTHRSPGRSYLKLEGGRFGVKYLSEKISRRVPRSACNISDKKWKAGVGRLKSAGAVPSRSRQAIAPAPARGTPLGIPFFRVQYNTYNPIQRRASQRPSGTWL